MRSAMPSGRTIAMCESVTIKQKEASITRL
jgi:hypothetical protein